MPEATLLHIQARESGAARVMELPGVAVRIGRGAECEVRLGEPDLAEVQCLLRRRGGAWHVQPVGPPGRVTIGGRAVEHQRPLPLGVPLRVGDTWLTLRPAEPTVPSWGRHAPPPPTPTSSTPAESAGDLERDRDRLRRWEARLGHRERWLRDRLDERRAALRRRAGVEPREESKAPEDAPAPAPAEEPAPALPVAEPIGPSFEEVAEVLADAVDALPAPAPVVEEAPAPPVAEDEPPPAPPPGPTGPVPLLEIEWAIGPGPLVAEPEPGESAEWKATSAEPENPSPQHSALVAQHFAEGPLPGGAGENGPPSPLRGEGPGVRGGTCTPLVTPGASIAPHALPTINASVRAPLTPGPPPRGGEGRSMRGGTRDDVADPPASPDPTPSLLSTPADAHPSPPAPLPGRDALASRLFGWLRSRREEKDEEARAVVAEPETAQEPAPEPPPVVVEPIAPEPAPEPARAEFPEGLRERQEWPSARAIFAAQAARQQHAAPRPEAKMRTSSRAVLPTAAEAPGAWNVPGFRWLGPPLIALALVVGAGATGLAALWARDDQAAGLVADRLLVDRRPWTADEAGALVEAAPSGTSWWRSTAGHLLLRAIAAERSGDAAGARALLDAARGASPLEPGARFALAHLEETSTTAALGLSRDVAALAWTGRRLLDAGKVEAGLGAYRAALGLAIGAEPSRLPYPAYLDDARTRRYALPREALIGPVVRDLAGRDDWPFERWAAALPGSAVAALAAGRALLEKEAPDAPKALEMALAAAEPAAAGARAEHLAATAEALALLGRWDEAERGYRAAIEAAGNDRDRRAWQFNLAEVRGQLGDDAGRDEARAAAKGPDPNDEISRRAARAQHEAGAGSGAGGGAGREPLRR